MRASWVALVLAALFLAAAPLGAAHEGGLHHGAMLEGTLAPGAQVSKGLEYGGGQLAGGWIFLLGGRVTGGPLHATLSLASGAVNDWSIPPGDTWTTTIVLPETAAYTLLLENRGTSAVSYTIYFDQSCECSGKLIFPNIPDGIIIFNHDTTGPAEVFAQFNEPRAMRVKVTAALRTGPAGDWPADFTTLAVSSAPVERTVGGEPILLHELTVEVSSATRVYYFVQGLELTAPSPTPPDLLISPFYEDRGTSSSGFPWLYVGVAAIAAIAAAALLLRRQRAIREEQEARKRKGSKRRGSSPARRRRRR